MNERYNSTNEDDDNVYNVIIENDIENSEQYDENEVKNELIQNTLLFKSKFN